MLTKVRTETTWPALFTLRPVTLDDVAAAVDLFDACAMAEIGTAKFTIDDVRAEWQLPDFDLERSTRAAVTPDGRLVGYVEVWDINAMPVNPWLWGRVHPDFLGQGIGTSLMTWAEGRARQVITRVPADARVAIRSGTLSSQTAAKRLFEKVGMSLIRHSWHMAIELSDALPAPQWPANITLRTYQDMPDLGAIFRATDEAFRDHWGHIEQPEEKALERWRYFIESDKVFDPSLWFLAMAGDEVAAVALCRARAHEDPEMGFVNTLGVRRPWRRQGLGLALLHHAFGEFYRRGQKRVGLGVDASNLTGATRLYEKAGMHVARQFDLYEKEVRTGKELSTQAVEA
jgi:mycothiol synthase